MKQKPRLRAIVRAFDIILTFESDKLDSELEGQVNDLIKSINLLLQKQDTLESEFPQLEFDDQKGKKKIKIGVTPIVIDTDEDE